MAVITMPDGINETIFDEQDFIRLIEEYMGFDARQWFEEWFVENSEYVEYLENETEDLRSHHKDVMEEIRAKIQTIALLISKREIDHEALSAALDIISRITLKECAARTVCDDCEEDCPHAEGRHYDNWGEGISTPDWCPQRCDELPF